MNTHDIKKDFPIFTEHPELIYLDSAATALTPNTVIDKMRAYYTTFNANIARGSYAIGEHATREYEASREAVARFIGAEPHEIVFTSGTTMSINMVAHGLSHILAADDNVVTTAMEHHANFIPWQQLCHQAKTVFRVAPITTDGLLDTKELLDLIDDRTRICALTHVSNVLGTINPLSAIIAEIRDKNPNTIIVVDAAQSIAHLPCDVVHLDCDFLAFSLHKLFGPTGVGVLYGKRECLAKLAPLLTGGDMIQEVTTRHTSFRENPHRLEAGTPNISGVVAVQEALDYVSTIGYDAIRAHDEMLLTYCINALDRHFHEKITIIGPDDITMRSGLISFTFGNYHPHDIATILDNESSIAIRAGQHCAMPLHMEYLHTAATARISFSIYNTTDDIDMLIDGLKKVERTLTNGKL
jgi:cysteine desulfurase/selenocysteine lyase